MEENNLQDKETLNQDQKDAPMTFNERREYFSNELNKYQKTNKIFLYKEDCNDLDNDNFTRYSRNVFNNKKNFSTYKKILTVEILKIISTCIYLVSLFIAIPAFIEKDILNPFGLVYVGGFIFFISVGFISEFVYQANNIADNDNKYPRIKVEYFVSEYLKCKYETINSVSLNQSRIDEIKAYLNYYYYHFSDKSKPEFTNNSKIAPSYTNDNYIDKANKFAKIIGISAKLYIYFDFLFLALFAILVATMYI